MLNEIKSQFLQSHARNVDGEMFELAGIEAD